MVQRSLIALIALPAVVHEVAGFSPSPLAGGGLRVRFRPCSAYALSSLKEPAAATSDEVDLGGIKVSSVGIGAWSWGDALFWGYDPAMEGDAKLAFNAVSA